VAIVSSCCRYPLWILCDPKGDRPYSERKIGKQIATLRGGYLTLTLNFMILTAIITLPENFVSSITTNMGQIITDLSPYLTLIIGVILGALVIRVIIGALHK